MEIVLRWGETLLEVVRAEEFAVDGTPLVVAGEAVVAPVGAVGPIAYELRAATAVEPLPAPRGDRRVVPYLAAAAAVHVVAVMCALAIPAPMPPVPQPRPVTHRARIAPAPAMETGQGDARAMDGGAGATGAPIEKPAAGHVAIANTGELPQLSRAEAIERARHAGILGSRQISPDAFASLAGHDPVTSGFDEHSAEAALADGNATGGGFGWGRTGFQAGGGGGGSTSGWGTIGHYSADHQFGHGWSGASPRAETWGGHWDGDYPSLPHRHLSARSHLEICDGDLRAKCVVEGALDPRVVRRYVKRNVAKLGFCFEKDQLVRPADTRELVVAFELDGTVQSVTAAGAGEAIEACVAEVIRGLELPKGPTHVAYYLRYHRRDAGSTDRDPVRVRGQ